MPGKKQEKRITTYSELSCFKSCPQQHEYRYEIGWRPKSPASPATLIGAGIHKGTEWLYRGETFENCTGAIRALFNGYVSSRHEDLDDPQRYYDARDLTIEIFRNYITHWWGEDSQTARHPVTGELLIEFEFEVPVFTPSGKASRLFRLRGKIDRVLLDGGEFWILDTKGKDDLRDDAMSERLVFDKQMRLYCWAMQVYLGIPIAGAVFDLVRRKAPGKPAINKNGEVSLKSVDTTVEAYTQLLIDQDAYLQSVSEEERKEKKLASGIDFEKYDPEIERLKTIKWFDRVWQRYSPEDYQAIQQEIYQVSLQMHRCQYPYGVEAACDHWGGCRYKPICRGLDPEGIYVRTSNIHPELSQAGHEFHPPLGQPYKILDRPRKIGFESILETVCNLDEMYIESNA